MKKNVKIVTLVSTFTISPLLKFSVLMNVPLSTSQLTQPAKCADQIVILVMMKRPVHNVSTALMKLLMEVVCSRTA